VKRALARAVALIAWTGAASLVGGCSSTCSGVCTPPVFDLAMGRMDDLAIVHDLAITTAGVVMVGAGATNAFSPATLTIQAGQGVTWNWVSGFHSVVYDSAPKAFDDSPAQAAGQFVVMFPVAGMYPYHCGVHGVMMSGTVVVQ